MYNFDDYCCFVNWLKHETLARVAAQTRTYTLNLSKALLMVINVKDLLQIKDLTLFRFTWLKKRYWAARDHLTIDDDLIVYGCRLLIPAKMRPQILAQLHESHQESARTKQRPAF